MLDLYLVGVDGSEGGHRAFAHALRAARRDGARLLVAHVIDWSPYTVMPPQDLADQHRRHDEQLAHATGTVLEPLAVEARAAGVEVEILARHGHAAATLAGVADERGAVQIFVGRHGHSRVHEVLFGSVPLALVHKAAVPVTVVP
jgi:nucleotide-binding universal stress UspA family protein